MRKSHLRNVILMVVAFAAISCERPGPCPTSTRNIGTIGLVITPYTDTSQISFLNIATNDTLSFDCIGMDSSYIIEHNFNGDCYQDVYLLKMDRKFICSISSDTIIVRYLASKIHSSEFYIFYNKIEYSMLMQYPMHFDSTFVIQNTTYNNVAKFWAFLHPNANYTKWCYFNSDFGILKLETTNGILELLKLKR